MNANVVYIHTPGALSSLMEVTAEGRPPADQPTVKDSANYDLAEIIALLRKINGEPVQE